MIRTIDKKVRSLQRIYGVFLQKFGIRGIRICRQLRDTKDSSPIIIPSIQYPIRIRKEVFSDFWLVRTILVLDAYKFKLESPKTILDLGANIGLFSVYMKNKFPDSKIVFVEPDQGNFELAKENLKDYEGVTGVHAGIWSKDTKLKISNPDAEKMSFRVEESPEGTIDALSIPTVMEMHQMERIDVLKIDIETAEKELFTTNYEEWLKRCRYLIIETHDRHLENCSKTIFEALNRTFEVYELSISDENLIIENKDWK